MAVDLKANKEMLDMMVDFLLSAHTGVHWDNGKPSTPTEHTLTESKNALKELIENDKKVTIKNTHLTIPNTDPPINMWGEEQTEEERLKIGIDLKKKEYDILSQGALEAFGVEGELTKEQKIQVVEKSFKKLGQIANPQDGEGRPDEPEMSEFQKRLQNMQNKGYKKPKGIRMARSRNKLGGKRRRSHKRKSRKSRRGRKSRRKSKKSRRKRRRTRRRRR
jgi:hypothetical protein